MNRLIRSIPLGALLAVVMASASAQTTAPAAGASAPATVGVTPQEAATANRQAVPRSDTATVVRTAPSPAARASDAVNNSAASGASTAATGATGSTAATSGTTGTTGNGSMGTTRAARADRN